MKQLVYFCMVFFLFANSCGSTTKHSLSDSATEKLSEQTPKSLISNDRTNDIPPSFPGGKEALQDFINKNKRHIQTDSIESKRKTVYVMFTVAYTGELSDFEIVRSLTPECDDEALRLIKSMPKWIPASRNGEPFDIKIGLQIQF